jgi:hypothetical protein
MMSRNTGGTGFAFFILALVVACCLTCALTVRAQEVFPFQMEEGYGVTLLSVSNSGDTSDNYWLTEYLEDPVSSFDPFLITGTLGPGEVDTFNLRDFGVKYNGIGLFIGGPGLAMDWIQARPGDGLAYSGINGEFRTNHLIRFSTMGNSKLVVAARWIPFPEHDIYCDSYPATIRLCPENTTGECVLIPWYSNDELTKLGTLFGLYEIDLGLAFPGYTGGTLDICLHGARMWSVLMSDGQYSVALEEMEHEY